MGRATGRRGEKMVNGFTGTDCHVLATIVESFWEIFVDSGPDELSETLAFNFYLASSSDICLVPAEDVCLASKALCLKSRRLFRLHGCLNSTQSKTFHYGRPRAIIKTTTADRAPGGNRRPRTTFWARTYDRGLRSRPKCITADRAPGQTL